MNTTIKKKLIAIFAAFALAFTALLVPIVPTTVSAAPGDSAIQDGIDDAKGAGVPDELFGGEGSIFTTVVNVLLFIIGAICVIMLIWGGIRYTTSAGNAASVTAAKNTIMYAIIGLVIAFLAFAIVNWVLGAIDPSTN
jgi:ABC-type Fe3+ transport system permease subunit